jgi:hypothetical protein
MVAWSEHALLNARTGRSPDFRDKPKEQKRGGEQLVRLGLDAQHANHLFSVRLLSKTIVLWSNEQMYAVVLSFLSVTMTRCDSGYREPLRTDELCEEDVVDHF